MKLIDIKSNNTPIWSEVWDLYISSFPEYERRGVLSHQNASQDKSFNTKVALNEEGNLLAFIFYWKINNMIYIEHLAVNTQNRGGSIGTKVVQTLLDEHIGYNVILEIEPPVTEITQRRLRFYNKFGFKENPYEYTHPSYAREIFTYRLDILSYPNKLSQMEYDSFCEFISNVILSYIE